MRVSRNVATVLLERVFDNYLWELADDAQQIVGPERGERGSQLDSMISKVEFNRRARSTQTFDAASFSIYHFSLPIFHLPSFI